MKATLERGNKTIRSKYKSSLIEGKKEKGVGFPDYARMVEKKAYELYEKRGRANGCDWEDWFEAEKIVEEEMIAGR